MSIYKNIDDILLQIDDQVDLANFSHVYCHNDCVPMQRSCDNGSIISTF